MERPRGERLTCCIFCFIKNLICYISMDKKTLVYLFISLSVCLSVVEKGLHYVTQVVPELEILLPCPPKPVVIGACHAQQ